MTTETNDPETHESSDPVIVEATTKAKKADIVKPIVFDDDDPDRFDPSLYSVKLTANSDVKMVSWDRLFSDVDFNIRDKGTAYTKKELLGLRTNVEARGLEEALDVHDENGDGSKLLILRGNRRYHMMRWMREDHLEAVKAGTAKMADMPWKKVPVKIQSHLSYEDKVARMLDHGQRRSLSDLELFEAVRRLVELGWGEKRILNHLQETRGNLAGHIKVAKMPVVVQQMYVDTKSKKEGAPNLKREWIDTLSAAWNEDLKKGNITSPAGGPAFQAKMAEFKKEGASNRSKTKSTQTRVEGEIQFAVGHHMLLDYVNALLGNAKTQTQLADSRRNILAALGAMFPQDDVIQVEEGVTKTLSQIPANDETDSEDSGE